MHYASTDHIENYTVSCIDVNKKLSFQGWEKCVKAFSQGKGYLSYRCSQLIPKMDSSQLDATISWSSSDEECDEATSQQMRRMQRRSRQLFSRINFDDCKPVRIRGRRRTSALFMRSVEKRQKRNLDGNNSSFDLSDCLNSEQSTVSANMSDSIIPLTAGLDSSKPGDDCDSSSRNLSILNHRIDLSSDGSESFASSVNCQKGTEASDSVKEETQFFPSSPILRSCQKKVMKKPLKFPVNAGVGVEDDKSAYKSPLLDSVPSSPVFKTNRVRRRNELQAAKALTPRLGSNVLSDDNETSLPCSTSKDNSFKSEVDEGECHHPEMPSKNKGSLVFEMDVTSKSPESLKKYVKTPISPIIGKSSRAKRRPPKKPTPMEVEKLLSPILVSKFKPHLTRTNGKSASGYPFNGESKRREEEELLPVHGMNRFHNTPALGAKQPSDSVTSESNPTQSRACAKRSLDFSHQIETGKADVKNCDTDYTSGDKSNQSTCLTTVSILSNLPRNQCVTEKFSPRRNNKIQDHLKENTQFIEEINSEQPDCVYVLDQREKSPVHSQRKKMLKLGSRSGRKSSWHEKSEIFRPTTSASRFQTPALGNAWHHNGSDTLNRKQSNQTEEKYRQNTASTASKQKISSTKSLKKKTFMDTKILSVSTNKSLKKMASAVTDEASAPAKYSPNHTLLIEEELSEPMELPPLNVSLPAADVQNEKLDEKCITGNIAINPKDLPKRNKKSVDNTNEVDIDSCSSQSPNDSQLTQIEKLPSSCVSSPLTISQSSSPPAPVGSSALINGERINDDFNAPPKKGKKKLKPDGLASRLQRLLNRQRSSSRIWQYQRSKQGKSNTLSASKSVSDSSMLLFVQRTWIEYSHVIVHGYLNKDISGGRGTIDSSSNCVILVVDSFVAEKMGKIMTATRLRIFPPWQGLKLRGVSLILCAHCIEIVSPNPPLQSDIIVPNTRDIEVSIPFKEGLESTLGGSISDIIFPKVVEMSTRLFQHTEATVDKTEKSSEASPCQGTISSLVSSHYVGNPVTGLRLTILRAFHFRQTNSEDQGNCSLCWSLLGQDVLKEVCEIVLGCEKSSAPERSIWQDVHNGAVIGKTYNFSGFLPIQRISPFRVSNAWQIVSSMNVLGPHEQPVVYVLAAASSGWACHPEIKEKKLDIFQPYFTSLSFVLSKSFSETKRVNIICSLLHASNERLYVTDVETSPGMSRIIVNPTAYIPPLVPKAAVVSILDAEVVSGELRADKYTKVTAINEKNLCNFKTVLREEEFESLATVNPKLPILDMNTLSKSLVVFFGTVVGVDEESAYMWPACGICENELLSIGGDGGKYCCEKCNDQSNNFVLRMSLQVLCSCPNLPQNSVVRLKLLQNTIETLLPRTQCGEEGYDMNAVLGQNLGPLRCEVLHSKDVNFSLQELG